MFLVFGVLICVGQSLGKIHNLPEILPRCHRSDSTINECLLKAANAVRPLIVPGLKEIWMPPLIEYTIPSVEFTRDMPGVRHVKALFTHTQIYGLEDYYFEEIQYDPNNLTLSGRVTFKNLTTTSNYSGGGYILTLPKLYGGGPLQLLLGPTEIPFRFAGKLVEKKKEMYYSLESSKVTLSIHNFTVVRLDGLFNDDNLPSRYINSFITANSEELSDIFLEPAFEVPIEMLFTRYLKHLTSKIKYDDLLPI